MLHPLTGQNIDPNADHDADQSADLNDEKAVANIAASDLLMAIANGLILVFLGYAIVDSLPLELLKPDWQIRFVARLLNLGFLPLLGFACFHLATILNPANSFYRHRLKSMRRWAMVAAIGFLLLIPLQGFATWRSYTAAKTNQQTLIQQANKRLAPLKQAIESATSTAELQQKLARLPGFRSGLTQEDLSRPLDVLKKGIIANLERSENVFVDRIAATTDSSRIWAAIQAAVRTLVVSLGYFMAFAAGAQPGRSSLTLADILSLRFQSLFGGRQRRRSRRGG